MQNKSKWIIKIWFMEITIGVGSRVYEYPILLRDFSFLRPLGIWAQKWGDEPPTEDDEL